MILNSVRSNINYHIKNNLKLHVFVCLFVCLLVCLFVFLILFVCLFLFCFACVCFSYHPRRTEKGFILFMLLMSSINTYKNMHSQLSHSPHWIACHEEPAELAINEGNCKYRKYEETNFKLDATKVLKIWISELRRQPNKLPGIILLLESCRKTNSRIAKLIMIVYSTWVTQ